MATLRAGPACRVLHGGAVLSVSQRLVLLLALCVAPRASSAQRLDPQLLLRWQTVPHTRQRPGSAGSLDVVGSETLTVWRDGRLDYHRRDAARPERARDVRQQLTEAAQRALHAMLRRLCALPRPPPQPLRPGDVRVDVQWSPLAGCTLALPVQRWRRGPTGAAAAHIEGLRRSAARPQGR